MKAKGKKKPKKMKKPVAHVKQLKYKHIPGHRGRAMLKKKPLKLRFTKMRTALSVKITQPRHKDLILVLDFGSQ